MSNNGNGWVKYLVGVLVSLTLFIAIPTMANHIIENDRCSRQRDDEICKTIDANYKEQQKVNEAILVSLAKIETDLAYLKQKAK